MTTGQITYDMDELLHFYAESGVDIALSENPVNQFAQSQIAETHRHQQIALSKHPASHNADRIEAATSLQSKKIASKPVAQPTFHAKNNQIVPDAQQITLAKKIAASAESLQELRESLSRFDGCGLKFTAKNLCFDDGNPASGLMFIGDVPGRDEDMEGQPFAGRVGQLFENMLRSIGLTREQTYLANIIYWRPPGNRVPTPLEIELCQPFIERQIVLARPKIIVGFGGPVTKLLTNATDTILRVRGNWLMHQTKTGEQIPFMPSLHPAYLLRSPAQKRYAWQDLLSVKAKLSKINQ